MGTYDISRVAFDANKRYAGVRMQQGRVATDDDKNENERIENEERRRARVDIIGPYGSPDQGFKIVNLNSGSLIDFEIKPGTVYLGGLTLEIAGPKPETYRTQTDWLQQPANLSPSPNLADGEERFDLVYLEAWQQAVSAVEDEELFEVALGGPDTSTRIRNMRRVIMLHDVGHSDCHLAFDVLKDKWKAHKLGTINEEHELIRNTSLQVSYSSSGDSEDLCAPNIVGGYLGAENQAIRVQIVGQQKITWGFNNAAPLYRIEATGNTVNMLTAPKDQHHFPLAGQIVEILPWSAVLSNREKIADIRGHFSRVDSSYNPDTGEFTLTTPLPANFGLAWQSRSDSADLYNQETPFEHYYLRVWDRGSDLTSDPVISFSPGLPVPLGQTGLEVTLTGSDAYFGDHWVIAARPETPDQVVPWKLETGMPPIGIRRFYAPLAIIRWYGKGGATEGEIIRDCRKTFRPLTNLETCCTYHVGDGKQSFGDFNSIEEALQNLPEEGGKICVLPGKHLANVSIIERRQVQISGCGKHSIIRSHPDPDKISEPIFYIDSSKNIRLDHMTLVTSTGSAIVLNDNPVHKTPSNHIRIDHNCILAGIHAISIRALENTAGENDIHITYNEIGMFDMEEGRAAIFSIADDVLIERNRIVVVPAPDPDDIDDPRDPDVGPPGGYDDPCSNPVVIYHPTYPIYEYVSNTFYYINAINLTIARTYKALGGIQIGGTSERVRILENEIIGGKGNGITLGHWLGIPAAMQQANYATNAYGSRSYFIDHWPSIHVANHMIAFYPSVLYEIEITGNHIQRMGLSGIGVVAYFDLATIGLMVEVYDLTAYRNTIKNCAQDIPAQLSPAQRYQVAFGGITLTSCENAVIQENRIEKNGLSFIDPICGIFILYGDNITIDNNRIFDNGPRSQESRQDVLGGNRGGIVIKETVKRFQQATIKGVPVGLRLKDDGSMAVKVHNNTVVQPIGHALYIGAFGPVSVVGNQLTAQEIDPKNQDSLDAGAVWIHNKGISKDYRPWYHDYQSGFPKTATNAMYTTPLYSNVLVPSGQVLFTNNQVTLDLLSEETATGFSSILIVTLDDIGCNDNQSECLALYGGASNLYDIVYINTYLKGFSIRSNDNRFQEGYTLSWASLLSYGYMNTALGNQATHCIFPVGTLVPTAPLMDDLNVILYGAACRQIYPVIVNHLNIPDPQ